MAKSLDQNEWYFEECPTDEIDYCWTYEYARESETLRRVIMEWRRSAKGNKIEDYVALVEEIYAEPFGLSVYPFMPCWPGKPYLSIDPGTRRAWLDQLGFLWDLGEEEAYTIQVRSWSRESTLKMLEKLAADKSLSFRKGPMQYVVFNVDWTYHDNQLVSWFRSWLTENRPPDSKAFEMRGRGNPARKGKANLKYLTIFRLRKKMSRDDAIAFLKAQGGRLRPYSNYQDWDLAVAKAETIIRSLEAGTSVLPPNEEGSQGEPINEKVLKGSI